MKPITNTSSAIEVYMNSYERIKELIEVLKDGNNETTQLNKKLMSVAAAQRVFHPHKGNTINIQA